MGPVKSCHLFMKWKQIQSSEPELCKLDWAPSLTFSQSVSMLVISTEWDLSSGGLNPHSAKSSPKSHLQVRISIQRMSNLDGFINYFWSGFCSQLQRIYVNLSCSMRLFKLGCRGNKNLRSEHEGRLTFSLEVLHIPLEVPEQENSLISTDRDIEVPIIKLGTSEGWTLFDVLPQWRARYAIFSVLAWMLN